jgi:PTS system nitrogen regulatory IIA component
MHITEIFKKEFIIEDLKARSKRGVLTELSDLFALGSAKVDTKHMVDVLMEREKLGSTGIGDGIAIPHGKLKGLETLLLSFGRSREGVDFESIDGKPVHLFFLLMAPESSTGQHLKALAKISRMLKDERFRSELLSASSAEALFKAITEKDETF